MATQTKKQEVNFLFPQPGDRRPTLEEYNAHLDKAERSPDRTLTDFKNTVSRCLKKLPKYQGH